MFVTQVEPLLFFLFIKFKQWRPDGRSLPQDCDIDSKGKLLFTWSFTPTNRQSFISRHNIYTPKAGKRVFHGSVQSFMMEIQSTLTTVFSQLKIGNSKILDDLKYGAESDLR